MATRLNAAGLIGIAAMCAWLVSCSSPTGNGESVFPDTKITVTVSNGPGSFTIVSQDPDDWQIHPSKIVHYALGGRQLDPRITPAYPNPAHDSTSLEFTMGLGGLPSFRMYTSQGVLVKTLFKDPIDAGAELIVWHLDDEAGNRVPPGYYRCVYSWNTAVCDGPPGTSCSQMIDLTVSGHGDIKVD